MSKAIDLTGSKIGLLELKERKRESKRTYYYYICDCGNKGWIRSDCLKTTKSCGCLSQETQFKSKDITNKRYGRLTIIEDTKERDKYNRTVIWKCKCDCGNICFISAHDINSNRVKSCGCLGKENSRINIQKAVEKHLKEHIIDNTNIPAISRKHVQSNNTSGITGVMWDNERKKWKAVITFKKKVYQLGRYDNKEDAIKIRKEAEDKLFGEFLEWYNNRKEI